jgi:NAD-reducing hydrogenase large subunit
MDLYTAAAGDRQGRQQDLRPGDNQKYLDYIAEEVRDWSYMKFPFIKSIGPEKGWYRVGPLARVNVCDFIDTPRPRRPARSSWRSPTASRTT